MKTRHCIYLLCLLLLTACYKKPQTALDAYVSLTERQIDSLSFQDTHHYTNNYNFIVDADSLMLLSQQPEEMMSDLQIDTFHVYKDELLVVADIRIIPTDTVDSVWVEVANGQAVFGWTHESDMLDKVVPDDPISQFISAFSDIHLLIFLIFLVFMAVVYMAVMVKRKNLPFVHFRDIKSFYPMLLCIVVALTATLYASIQMFAAEEWQDFYFHPTLNPFSVPTILSIFLACVWAMIVIAIATVDDVKKTLPVGDAVLYLGGVAAVCAINYLVFSLSTLYYVGYLLFALYVAFALRQYFRYSFAPFVCGNCGSRLRRKGRCPYCGTMNE